MLVCTHAAVAVNISINLAFVRNLTLIEKAAVKSPMAIKRIKLDPIEYKTTVEATGRSEASTAPIEYVRPDRPA